MGKKKTKPEPAVTMSSDRIATFQVSVELHERAVAFAGATGRTFSAVQRIALEEYLNREGG